jgi:hypothetical protein
MPWGGLIVVPCACGRAVARAAALGELGYGRLGVVLPGRPIVGGIAARLDRLACREVLVQQAVQRVMTQRLGPLALFQP